MSVTCNIFQSWVDYMVEDADLASDTFKVTFCAAASEPSVSEDGLIADISQIATIANCDSVTITTTSSSQTAGTYELVLEDKVVTATDTFGPLQFAVVYDDTVASDPLVCYYDYGSEITLAAAETLTVDFDADNGVFSIAPPA